MGKITLIPLKTPLIQMGDTIEDVIFEVITEQGIEVEEGDVVIVAETPVAVAEGRVQELEKVKPSRLAKELAQKYQMDPQFVEIVVKEADEIIGGVKGVLLTYKNNTLIANAGVDYSNAPPGTVVLFPKNPRKTVRVIRKYLVERFQKKIAVILGDSRVQPLRRGTVGVAIAVAGMEPIEDFRGKKDLYGRELQITFRAIADDLVSAAQMLMGESDERIPAVLIKGAPIQLIEDPISEMGIPKEECLFMNSFTQG